MERKDVYLDKPTIEGAEIIVEKGYANSMSGAIRIAVIQFAAAVMIRPPMVTPTTP